jgi:hypothetical protein
MILLIFIVHHDISMDSLQLQAEMPALLALVIEAMKTHPSAPEAWWAGGWWQRYGKFEGEDAQIMMNFLKSLGYFFRNQAEKTFW